MLQFETNREKEILLLSLLLLLNQLPVDSIPSSLCDTTCEQQGNVIFRKERISLLKKYIWRNLDEEREKKNRRERRRNEEERRRNEEREENE